MTLSDASFVGEESMRESNLQDIKGSTDKQHASKFVDESALEGELENLQFS